MQVLSRNKVCKNQIWNLFKPCISFEKERSLFNGRF